MGLTLLVLSVAILGFVIAAYLRASPQVITRDSDEIADFPPVLPPSAMAHLAAIAAKDAGRDLRSDWAHTGLRLAD